MSTTVSQLFTDAELDAQIAAYKGALTGLAQAQSYQMDFGGQRTNLTRADLAQIRSTLEWLQTEKTRNAVGRAPQIFSGRVRRG